MESEQVKNVKKWVKKHDVNLKGTDKMKTKFKKFYSVIHNEFITVQNIKGFCPACEEPLLINDVRDGYCGNCGANLENNIKTKIKLEEE